MNSTNNKVLFILPYYNPFLNEGAKNRMDTFMDIAYRNGYNVFAVVGLNASYYFKSFFKKPLIREYNWIILPFFGMFRNFFFHAITLLLFRLTIKMLYSKNTFIFCQAETTVGGYLAVQTKKKKVCSRITLNAIVGLTLSHS